MDMDYFNQEATGWDTPLRSARATCIAEKISAHINPQTDKKALDFGCGTGLLSFALADKLPQISVTDPSSGMIQIVRQKIAGSGMNHISILPYAELDEDCYFGRFNLIYSSMVFHHLANVDADLFRLRHLLIKGGHILIVDLDPVSPAFHESDPNFQGHNGFPRDEFRKILKRGGFTEITFEDCYSSIKELPEEKIPYSLFLACAQK